MSPREPASARSRPAGSRARNAGHITSFDEIPAPLARAAGVTSMADLDSASLGDLVTAALRRDILIGELTPGERLIERNIATRLGVSRSPVREALHRLEEEGFARTLSAGGAYVSLITVDALRDIFEVRSALEWRVGQLVATKMGERHVEALQACAARMARGGAIGDVDAEIQADLEFHTYLAHLSGNERLEQILRGLHSQILRVVHLSVTETPWEERVTDHEYLIATLARRDPQLAAAALELHVVEAGKKAVTALRRQIADAAQHIPGLARFGPPEPDEDAPAAAPPARRRSA